LGRDFGYNNSIIGLTPERNIPRNDEDTYDLLQEFDSENRRTTIETDFQSNRGSFAVVQCHISAIAEGFDEEA
jgi:hypothetical protein